MPRSARPALAPLVSAGVALVTLLGPRAASAAEFFVDPVGGSASGDGSAAKPWGTLQQVAGSGAIGTLVRAGDTIWLRAGHHGAPVIAGGDFTPAITIAAAPGAKATASSVTFKGTKGWALRGLSLSPSFAATPTVVTMVTVDPASARVTIEDNEAFSVDDASAWGATDWVSGASSGVSVRGADVIVRRNRLRNVRFGISVDGARARVERNQIVGFSADGLRGLGDDGLFEYNLVKNVYVDDAAGDANHDDGFQSWSVGAGGVGTGVVKGVVLRGNVFVNRDDPAQKLPNAMQGIGCFDGTFEGWVVENNVVITDHWHGISFYGMRGSRIVNNTVIDVNDVTPGPPWIKVAPHKDGTASRDVVVRNNLATAFALEGTNVTGDHNLVLKDLGAVFVDPAKLDLHLRDGAAAIDVGSAELAPAIDVEGIARPQGSAVDLGAYEWHLPSVTPADGGGAGGDASTDASADDAADAGGPSASGSSGCGCRATARGRDASTLALAGLAAALLAERRARRR